MLGGEFYSRAAFYGWKDLSLTVHGEVLMVGSLWPFCFCLFSLVPETLSDLPFLSPIKGSVPNQEISE